jgi:SAM-dependent methyltransferase
LQPSELHEIEDRKQFNPRENDVDDLLWKHLKTVPAFRALLRSVEARFYPNIDLPEPILDLGCGDGHFARLTFDQPLLAGIDPWWGPLKKAKDSGAYTHVIQSLGNQLPFSTNYFGSVISNSVLEHIPDVQPVLSDVSRVLRPGGKLVITVPSHYFTEYLGGAICFETIGIKYLADAYRQLFNRISRHAHTDPPERWAQRLIKAEFEIDKWQYYFSKRALHVLELGHIQGLPSAIIHFLTGHWILAPWRSNLKYTDRWVRPHYEEKYPVFGTMIILIAHKLEKSKGNSNSSGRKNDKPEKSSSTLRQKRQSI